MPTPDPNLTNRQSLRFATGPITLAWAGLALALVGPWIAGALFPDAPPIASRYLHFAAIICFIAAALCFRHRKRAIGRDLARSNYLLCRNCLHDLSASPETGLCPECAHPYTHHALRTAWLPFEPPSASPAPDNSDRAS